MKYHIYSVMVIILFNSCKQNNNLTSFNTYPEPTEKDLWISYSKNATEFKLWSPIAREVKLRLYNTGSDSIPRASFEMQNTTKGIWSKKINGNLNGTYYTYQIKIHNKWLNETPGIYAQAIGVNGERAMVIDLKSTNPQGWDTDKGPVTNHPNEAIIYELHIRDMTIHPNAGSTMPGKYLGLIEKGTTGPKSITTGIDHLKELGITHVHLLPTFDHYAIDETKLDIPQFNWGYDPNNYNVPEGSFSSDPFNAEVRIKEFKQMVKTFHENGIGVILDVVYNHTGKTQESNFNQEVPGYYYRHLEDGSYSDAAACGNETSSERAMMQKFMLESVLYWTKEYHLDGFRFDLMGIHDIATMNKIADAVKEVNPNALIYGEGWTAKDTPLPKSELALKKNTKRIPNISAFSDDIRDGLKGSVFEDKDTGFVSGAKNKEESIKFGIVGAIEHPQLNYEEVNYSNQSWANEPWQSISYVSCHDNHTLFDKLKISRSDASDSQLIAMDKLANAIVLTSQGTSFLHAGSEFLRTKNGEHNSYNLPDSINRIDWNRKADYYHVFEYYKNLITLRKLHPAFRMTNTKDVVKNLEFISAENGVISYTIKNNANGDNWKNILVIYNANEKAYRYKLEDSWQLAVLGDQFDENGLTVAKENIEIPPISMVVAYQK